MRILKIVYILELNSPRMTKDLQCMFFNWCRTIRLQSNNLPVIHRLEQCTVFGDHNKS